jgi:RNA polymerase sigma factor (TIGR02999 family)
LLQNYCGGDRTAGDQLFSLLYQDLRRLAASYLQGERPNHTLQPTALVHELYMRLFASDEPISFQNRAHFFAIAAQTLRRILVDHARAYRAAKRGGGQIKLSLTAAQGWAEPEETDLVALDEALRQLEQLDERAARVVELRFFGGLEEDQVAEVLGVAPITVKRDWKSARAWLMSQLSPDSSHP